MKIGRFGADVVVPMTRVRTENRFPMANEVRAYWEALRGAAPVPPRARVNPRGLERALEFTFVAERLAPGIARLRLAGMHLNDLMGMEVRGMPLTSLIAPEGRDRVMKAVEEVFSGPATVDISMVAEGGLGRPALEAHMLLLPLLSDRGEVNRILGCLFTSGAIGRAPRRFLPTSVDRRQIDTPAQSPHRSEPDLASMATTGFAEPRAGFATAPTPTRGRPALRLIKIDSH